MSDYPKRPELQSNYDLRTNPGDYIEWYDKDDVENFAAEWEEFARDLRERVAEFIRNGVEFGYIIKPEIGDPARDLIDEFLKETP